MKIRTSLVQLAVLSFLLTVRATAQADPPDARIVALTLNPQKVTVLHLRPGFVSSVRLPEEVSSVVLGDPAAFKGEHSEAEPRLVFFKPSSPKPAKTNALITTRSGREVSLTLVSEGSTSQDAVDYVLEYEPPHSFIIGPPPASFLIGETKHLESPKPIGPDENPTHRNDPEPQRREQFQNREWQGKELRVALGRSEENGQDMTVAFSVLNSSSRMIELLPPQVQLAGTAKQKHGKAITADPVALKDYRISTRRLAPGASADGVVVFERPAFKQSTDRLLLQIAQAEEVDRPVVVPISFVASGKGWLQ